MDDASTVVVQRLCAGVARGRTLERRASIVSRSCAPDNARALSGYTMGFIVRPASKQWTAFGDSAHSSSELSMRGTREFVLSLSRELLVRIVLKRKKNF